MTTATAPRREHDRLKPTLPRTERRTDIDGLRALSVGLVVVYHVWLGRVSGGVDVFLMISAYFLTEWYLRRAESGARLNVWAFWRRRFARLLPLAAITVAGVLAVVWAVYPPSRWHGTWTQSWASLFFVENFSLISSATDYYARSEATSPLQHFWSLSIQGQVFVLWPLLFLGIGWLSRRLGRRPREVSAVVFGVVLLASLAYSVVMTARFQEVAYFDTLARLWEFALGSLVAIALPALRLGARSAGMLVAAGLAGIVLCGLVLDVSGGFPGYLALWPTLSTAAVIIGGRFAGASAGMLFLRSRPMQLLGRNAYALYLVHWPVLITWLVVSHRDEAGLLSGFGVVAVSLVLAALLTRLVDRPLGVFLGARARVREPAALVLSVLLVLVPMWGWQRAEAAGAAADSTVHPGARSVVTGEVDARRDEPPIPAATGLEHPWFSAGESCDDRFPKMHELCRLVTSAAEPTLRVLVIGNSHAQQLSGSLEAVAERRGWEMTVFAAGGCGIGLDDDGLRPPGECRQWREDALSYLADVDPDVVVTIGSATVADSTEERLSPGLEATIEQIRARVDARVLLLRDTPRHTFNMYECSEQYGASAAECAVPVAGLVAAENPLRVFDPVDDIESVDLTEYICPGGMCRPVVGNVFVYFDDNHVTTEYARSLSWVLEDAMITRLGVG